MERHDLYLRADGPLAGATVLLTDAAHDLTELARTVFREQALTAEVRARGRLRGDGLGRAAAGRALPV